MIPYSAVDALASMRRLIDPAEPVAHPPPRDGVWTRLVALARRPAPITATSATPAGNVYREGAYGVDTASRP